MNSSPYCYETKGGATIARVKVWQAYDQILVDLALTSINEKYKIGNGNWNVKVKLNERNS